MYRISALLLTLSMVLTVWIAREVGLFSYTSVDAAEPVPAPGVDSSNSADERLKQAAEKEEALRKKERELNEKEALLNEQVKRYERISAEKAVKQNAQDRVLASETSKNEVALVYEKMDPKKAAKIIENLDSKSASQILNGMKKDRAAEILSRLTPDKAKQVTERLFAKGANGSAVQKVNSEQ